MIRYRARYAVKFLTTFTVSLCFSSYSSVLASETEHALTAPPEVQDVTKPQWYTGSLVSPSGAMTQKGILAIEPYVTYNQPVGYIDSNGNIGPLHPRTKNITNFTMIKYSITDNVSVQTLPTFSYRWGGHGNQTSSGVKFSDLPVDVMWRYLDANPDRFIPALSAFVGMAFPTGDYQRIDRTQDGVGSGTYTLRLALTEQSTYTLPGNHALRLRMWATLRKPLNKAQLHGMSSYGTEPGFRGNARAGLFGSAGFSLEYGINQKWVLAMDIARDWSNGSRVRGVMKDGSIIDNMGSPSGDWLAAPAVEFSWSPNFGVICGSSVYFAGHNTSLVVSPQCALNTVF